MTHTRAAWTSLSDALLLDQCAVDTYRASGPGGQKRNKTSSAVRLRHLPSGLKVIAEESRSQHQNRTRALKRLRQALYLQVRDELPAGTLSAQEASKHEAFRAACLPGSRLHLRPNDPRFWPTVGFVLDVLQAADARVSQAASWLQISTANLVDFLQTEPKVWQQANVLRARFGQKRLVT
jgi:hypothetical protein